VTSPIFAPGLSASCARPQCGSPRIIPLPLTRCSAPQSIALTDLVGVGLRCYPVIPAKAGTYGWDRSRPPPGRQGNITSFSVKLDGALARQAPDPCSARWIGSASQCHSLCQTYLTMQLVPPPPICATRSGESSLFCPLIAPWCDLSVKPAEVGGADYHSALRADGPFPPLAGDPDNAVRDRQRSRRRESSPNTAMLIAPAVRHLSGQRPCTHRRTALSGVGAADIWTFQ